MAASIDFDTAPLLSGLGFYVDYPRCVKAELGRQTTCIQIDPVEKAGVEYRTKTRSYTFGKHDTVNTVLHIAFVSAYMKLFVRIIDHARSLQQHLIKSGIGPFRQVLNVVLIKVINTSSGG